jgi:hypothetical protein
MVRFIKTGGTVFAAFIAGCLGGLCVILVHDRIGIHLRHTDPANWAVSSAEVMSTANTFIVYTTSIKTGA